MQVILNRGRKRAFLWHGFCIIIPFLLVTDIEKGENYEP
jgi:hypothetical protein